MSYPEYSVSYDGVGYDAMAPDDYGPCSQGCLYNDILAYHQFNQFPFVVLHPKSNDCITYFSICMLRVPAQIAVFTRNDFQDQVDNGETLDPPTSELKLMSEYQSTESEPFTAEAVYRWTVPQRPPDLRYVIAEN